MILAIDTVAPVVGVALLDGLRCATRVERVVRGTETRLPAWIRALCAEFDVGPGAITGVAVAVGPGAFTGLRVGIATATGLAMALGVPVWPCDGLRPRAERVGRGEVLALLDARKGRFYAARYRHGQELSPPADVAPEVALAGLSAGFFAVGEGAVVLRAAIEAAGGQVADGADQPGVEQLARLGEAAFSAGQGRDPVEIRPLYVREPDAIPVAERRTGWT